MPGSEQKILLMQDRAARGYGIFAPDDPTFYSLGEAAVGLIQPTRKLGPYSYLANGNGHNADPVTNLRFPDNLGRPT